MYIIYHVDDGVSDDECVAVGELFQLYLVFAYLKHAQVLYKHDKNNIFLDYILNK